MSEQTASHEESAGNKKRPFVSYPNMTDILRNAHPSAIPGIVALLRLRENDLHAETVDAMRKVHAANAAAGAPNTYEDLGKLLVANNVSLPDDLEESPVELSASDGDVSDLPPAA